jgi:uncharacterized metal-binding protein
MRDFSKSAGTTPPVCVLACSGCSAAGELADHTARRLQQLGAAQMSCLAGIGGRIPSILATVQKARNFMIDGCPLECEPRTAARGLENHAAGCTKPRQEHRARDDDRVAAGR